MRLASWNVLASSHLHPEYYPGCDAAALADPARTGRVRQALATMLEDCDVVAVQEVEQHLLDGLAASGVRVVSRLRQHHPDGVALLSLRQDLVALGGGDTVDGRRVWCAAEVGGMVVVATHVDFSTDVPHPGAQQMAQVLDAVNGLVRWHPSVPVAVGADLNAPWHSVVGDVLAGDGFAAASSGRATAAIGGRGVELDVIAVRGARVLPLATPRVLEVGQDAWLPDAATPSDHLPLVAELAWLPDPSLPPAAPTLH